MPPQPSKWALKLLHLYCKPSKLEAIEGDLHEIFDIRLTKGSPRKANLNFVWDVIRFLRWRNVKGLEDINSLTTIAMFRNYFKVSVRSLLRHKFYSIINILGLTIGISCCLFILMFVNHELNYDNFWKDSDRIYRVTLNKTGSNTPAQLVKQMRADYPEVEQGSRIQGPIVSSFSVDGKTISQDGGFIADSTFFEVFDVNFLYGNSKTALTEPNTVVITRSIAAKYFPEVDAVGKLIKSDGDLFKITGIIEDAPKNSHIQYKFIASIPREDWATKGWWTGNNFYSYLKLKENTDAKALEAKFPEFVKKYVGPEIIKFSGNKDFEEFLAEGNRYGYNLIPMKDIHLHHADLSMGSPGKIMNIYIFSVVAFFILLIACINFITLSTARSATRSKEVGVRKVLGSLRGQLVSQFMIESIIISTLSIIFAVILIIILLPQFNMISGKSFEISDVLIVNNFIWLAILGIIVGLLAGSYPALYLSKIQPVEALKGVLKNKKGGEFLRKTLVSFQFGISILLIISTMIVYAQISYMSNKDLGLNAEQTLIIKNVGKLDKNTTAFKNYLESIPEVKSVGMSNRYPSGGMGDWNYNTVEDIPIRMSPYNIFVNDQFIDALDVKIVDGRFFDATRALDSTSVVVNEAFVRKTNWDNVIDKQVSRGGDSRFNIIGVVKDFHFHSLRTNIRPLIMRFDSNNKSDFSEYNYMLVSIKGNYKSVLNKIESNWQNKVPNEPFNYIFLKDSFDNLYDSERKFGELFTVFAILAILIGSLGMLALAAFVIERRIKEIAIRKVMGASISQITSLLLKDFTKLVIIGGTIAIPCAYLLSQQWMENFKYQTDLSLYIYIVPVLIVILISWITVGYQTYKTAKSNPAVVLQND